MDSQPVMCPKCHALVDMRHDGTEPAANDFTSSWVFVEHMCDDWRDGENFPRPCTASGANLATALAGD